MMESSFYTETRNVKISGMCCSAESHVPAYTSILKYQLFKKIFSSIIRSFDSKKYVFRIDVEFSFFRSIQFILLL